MRVLLRLFPRAFRQRYGPEMLELLAASDNRARDTLDVMLAALSFRLERAGRKLGRLARRPAMLAVLAVAAALGASLGGCGALGSSVAFDGCSVLGGTLLSTACALAGSQLAARFGRWEAAG